MPRSFSVRVHAPERRRRPLPMTANSGCCCTSCCCFHILGGLIGAVFGTATVPGPAPVQPTIHLPNRDWHDLPSTMPTEGIKDPLASDGIKEGLPPVVEEGITAGKPKESSELPVYPYREVSLVVRGSGKAGVGLYWGLFLLMVMVWPFIDHTGTWLWYLPGIQLLAGVWAFVILACFPGPHRRARLGAVVRISLGALVGTLVGIMLLSLLCGLGLTL